MLIYFGRYVMQELGDGHYYWDILLSREIKQVTDESFVFSQDSTLVHHVCNTVPLLQHDTISPELWLHTAQS